MIQVIALSVLLLFSPTTADDQIAPAKKLFERYVTLEHAFDPAAAAKCPYI